MDKTSNKTVNVKADFRQFLADNAGLMALTAFFIGAMPVYAKRADRYLMLAMAALMVFMLSILATIVNTGVWDTTYTAHEEEEEEPKEEK